jgi:predicted DNA-binding transcriptional regulator YafY
LRLFLIDRLQKVEVSRERFEVPDDFVAADLTGSAFGLIDDTPVAVRVRFGAAVAHLIRERNWHPTQVLEEAADGSLVLSFTAGGEKELLAWLYSYLPHVEVLSPASLCSAFRQGLEQGLWNQEKPAN